jgi:hypothetical protein
MTISQIKKCICWLSENTLAIISAEQGFVLGSNSQSKTFVFTSSSPVAATIPNDATYNHAVGTQISLIQSGTGLLTVYAESPATVNGVSSVDSNGQYSGILLVKTSSNTWTAVGGV